MESYAESVVGSVAELMMRPKVVRMVKSVAKSVVELVAGADIPFNNSRMPTKGDETMVILLSCFNFNIQMRG